MDRGNKKMILYDFGAGQYLNLLDIKEIIDCEIRTGDNRWIPVEKEDLDVILRLLKDYIY